MSNFIPKIICVANSLYNQLIMLKVHYGYRRHYRALMKANNIHNIPVKGEKEYIARWKRLYPLICIEEYRYFSDYFPENLDATPEAVAHNIVENLLCPPEYRAFYCDKNMFDKLLPPEFLPRTVLRKINGTYYSCDYRPLSVSEVVQLLHDPGLPEKMVAKPTVNSSSGLGIVFFAKEGEDFILQKSTSRQALSKAWLDDNINCDFILQECLRQSPFMAQFNPSSVNTLRMLVYRSVRTNKAVVTAAIMRIGLQGCMVDNCHAGGASIGVSATGEMNDHVIDQYGKISTQFNGIDFSRNKFVIPDYEHVVALAEAVGEKLVHMRCINLDVMIDQSGKPRIIEYNLQGMGSWVFHFNVGTCFGSYNDEIIEYCCNNLKKVKHVEIFY